MENIMPYRVAEIAYANEIADIDAALSKIRALCPFEKLHDWLEIEQSVISERRELEARLAIIRKKISSTIPRPTGPFKHAAKTPVLTEPEGEAIQEAMSHACKIFDERVLWEIEQNLRAAEVTNT